MSKYAEGFGDVNVNVNGREGLLEKMIRSELRGKIFIITNIHHRQICLPCSYTTSRVIVGIVADLVVRGSNESSER